MAHFAQLDENNVVTQVIVVSNDDTSDSNGTEVESIGVAFCQKLLGADTGDDGAMSTGSGGGGSTQRFVTPDGRGGAGGSGIVIIAYPS